MKTALAICFTALLGAAGSGQAADTQKVNRLIDVSGMEHIVRQLLPGMLSGFDDPSQNIPANLRAALRDATAQAFQPDPMIERLRVHLRASLTARQLDDALAFAESPFGLRVTAMEKAVTEPAAVAGLEKYARELERRPLEKRRADLIAGVDLATGSSELSALMLEAGMLATVLGLNAAQPVQQQVPVDILRQKVKAGFPQLRQHSDQFTTLALSYAYRSLSDKELESYLRFLKSPSGSAFSKAALEGFRAALVEANARYMQAIPKALTKHKGVAGT